MTEIKEIRGKILSRGQFISGVIFLLIMLTALTVKRLQRIKQLTARYDLPLVQCFGSFRVLVYGETLSWKHSKAREILDFLVHKRGLPVDWTKIADAVWPYFDAQKAQANLNATTYLLRMPIKQ